MSRASGNFARGALLTLLLAPLVVVLDRLGAVGDLPLFVLACVALIPLSWLIGEATDNLARHTGPGIGGFLNATFGNAPELIIATIAASDGLTAIVRASLVGSIAGNLLLVLGFTLLFGQRGVIDRQSAYTSLGLVGFTTALALVVSVPGFHGDPERRSLAALSVPIAVLLLVVCMAVTWYALRRQRQLFRSAEREAVGWSMPAALVVLGIATVATAFVSETLVGTLQAFADMAHLSDFFVAAVIVAVLGNATEHGSAVLLARRGRVKLATEIPLASSAQIAGLVIPLVALISWGFTPLALGFRPVELAAMAVAAALPALVLRTGRTSRVGGAILLAAYSAFAVAAYLSGDGLRVRSLLQDRIVGNALAQDGGDEPGSASSSIVRPLKLPPALSTSPTGSTRRPCASSGVIVGSQFLEIFCWFLVT